MSSQKGFTLIELMVVISIIGILAAIAIPQFSVYRERAKVGEIYGLFDSAKKTIAEFYDHTGRLPKDNQMAGLAEPEAIKGKYVESLLVENGVVRIMLNENINLRQYGKTMWFYPAISKKDPTGPIFWIRKHDDIEPWMRLMHAPGGPDEENNPVSGE